MAKYLISFLLAFLLTVAFIFLLKSFTGKIKWRGRVSARHINRVDVFRVGGIAMIIAFNLALLLNNALVITPALSGVMLASLFVLVVGIWDDVREVFWKTQLFYQVAIAMLVYIFGLRIYAITNPLGGVIGFDSSWGIIISVLLVIAWIVTIINSMNWLDGIDGLSGGVSFICAMTMVVLSLTPDVNQPPVAIIALAVAGSILGFLVFNFYPSIIIAGTSGSMFMGFSLAILAIFAGTKIATAILVLALPIIDFVWVIGERLKKKKSIFKADKNHLHYKLMELGWSQRKIALYYYAVTLVIAIVALNTRVIGKTITLLAAMIVMTSALFFINKKLAQKK